VGLWFMWCLPAGAYSPRRYPATRRGRTSDAVAIAGSGERKSSVINHHTEPIDEYEREHRKQIAAAVARNKLEKKVLEGTIARLEKAAIRGNITDEERTELDVRIRELAEFVELHPLRTFVNDATPEKLIDIMHKQGGKIAICSAEGNLFDMLVAKNERGTLLLEPLKSNRTKHRRAIESLL